MKVAMAPRVTDELGANFLPSPTPVVIRFCLAQVMYPQNLWLVGTSWNGLDVHFGCLAPFVEIRWRNATMAPRVTGASGAKRPPPTPVVTLFLFAQSMWPQNLCLRETSEYGLLAHLGSDRCGFSKRYRNAVIDPRNTFPLGL